jgi:glycerophosphoryl diester phosphodiesterase
VSDFYINSKMTDYLRQFIFRYNLCLFGLFGTLLGFVGCAGQGGNPAASPAETTPGPFNFANDSAFHAFFGYQPGAAPIVIAHRGGPTKGYPENCLETFEATLAKGTYVIECDLRQTADGFFILFNERALDSTTSGKGFVAEKPLSFVRDLVLRGPDGSPTTFKAPTLEEAVAWARGRAILLLDVRNEVDRTQLLTTLSSMRAQRSVIIIPNGIEVAEWYHRHDPTLLLSLNMRNLTDWRELKRYRIDKRRMIAFLGFSQPPDGLVDTLHHHGISVQLATIGPLDQAALAGDSTLYSRLQQQGIDIITTNHPELAQPKQAEQR